MQWTAHALQLPYLWRFIASLHPKHFKPETKAQRSYSTNSKSPSNAHWCPLPLEQEWACWRRSFGSLLARGSPASLSPACSIPSKECEKSLALRKPYTHNAGPLMPQVSVPWFAFRSWTVPVSQAACWQSPWSLLLETEWPVKGTHCLASEWRIPHLEKEFAWFLTEKEDSSSGERTMLTIHQVFT